MLLLRLSQQSESESRQETQCAKVTITDENIMEIKVSLNGAVSDSNPIQFLSNSASISSQSANWPFCVCAGGEIRCLYAAAVVQ